MKIGWMQDRVGFVGGTEISCETLIKNAPDWIDEIHLCEANKRPPEVDLFIIQRGVSYDSRWIEVLQDTPFVLHLRDPWTVGDPVFKRWALDNAKTIIFNSPNAIKYFVFPVDQEKIALVPPPVDVAKFKAASQEERRGNIFVGRVGPTKGAHIAVDYAIRTGEQMDFYGQNSGLYEYENLPRNITFHGFTDYNKLPQIMGKAKTFHLYPMWVETYGRVVVEAWAAGCDLMVEGNVGALWWIEHQPDLIPHGIKIFWDTIKHTYDK